MKKKCQRKTCNNLPEFNRGKEDKDNFLQKALKVCKVFIVKPLKTPKPDVPSKKTAKNLFCKNIQKTKKGLQGVPVSKKSAIISKEWKKVKASKKKIKKYEDLYEEEKQRHEEALQRYQEDHMDEMGIINLHKKCNNKTRKVSQPKKASSDGKKVATKARKKVKKTSKPKEEPKLPKFIDSGEEEHQQESHNCVNFDKAFKTIKFLNIMLTLFRMGLFGAAHGWQPKKPFLHKSVKHILE